LNWGLGNIDHNPCFVDPGYWDLNSTPLDVSDDFWVIGDYHLKSEGWRWDGHGLCWNYDDVTSRCIDAGNPGLVLANEPQIVPGDPDKLRGENIRINMGVYGGTTEASIPPHDWALLSDITNDGIVDFHDFAHQAEMYADEEQGWPGDLNRDGVVAFSDIALFVQDWLSQTIWAPALCSTGK